MTVRFPGGLPFLPENGHVHKVDIFSFDPERLPRPPVFDEAAGQITTNGTGVPGMRSKTDSPCSQVSKSKIKQQADCLLPVAAAPVLTVTDSYAQFKVAMPILKAGERAMADVLAVSLDSKRSDARIWLGPRFKEGFGLPSHVLR